MAAVVGSMLAAAAPASAGTSTNQNSCKFNLDQVWRHAQIELGGVASPNPAAPGSGVALTQTSARLRLPDYIAEAGYGLGIFKAGENEIRAKVWLAVEGVGTPQGVQVHPFDAVAKLTITDDGAGTFVSSTPIDATVALPDTAWTVGTAAFTFRQAGAGSLPPVPAGLGGANVQPLGSAFIRAEVGGVPVLLDCQPAKGEGRPAPEPFAATPFETVSVQGGTAPLPAPKAVPVVALRTTKLKASSRTSRTVKVSLSCTAADCKGAVTLKAGSKAIATKKTYAVKSGTSASVNLKLTAAARKQLTKKKKLSVTLQVTTDGGKTISKKLTLR